MAQHRQGNVAHILFERRGASIERGKGLGAQNKVLGGARTGSVLQIVAHVLRGALGAGTRLCDEVHGVLDDMIGYGQLAHHLLIPDDFLGSEYGLGFGQRIGGGGAHDIDLLLKRGIVEPQVQHEAVELRFGERIRAFLLNRVLRSEHKERRIERTGLPACGNVALLHGLKERRLRFGRGTVDLIRQNDVGEDGSLYELKVTLPVLRLLNDVGSRNIAGHQVGRKLDAAKRQVQRARQRTHQQRFGESGHPYEQCVSACKEAGAHLCDDCVLSYDYAANFVVEALVRGADLSDSVGINVGVGERCRGGRRRHAGRRMRKASSGCRGTGQSTGRPRSRRGHQP